MDKRSRIIQGNMSIHKGRRISKQKYSVILRSFIADVPASKASKIARVSRVTADRYYNMFRKLIIQAALQERKDIQLKNGIEIDESYFGPTRIRGKRGRGASKKIIVLGLLKRHGKVYTQIINKAAQKELLPIIRKVVQSGADIYTDGWKSYNALAIYGYNHKKVIHKKNEFVRDKNIHINGVESFWAWAKKRLAQFNGIKKEFFGRYLLESEWRFNHRDTLHKDMVKLIRSKSKLLK